LNIPKGGRPSRLCQVAVNLLKKIDRGALGLEREGG
jgi:hypothetical protein